MSYPVRLQQGSTIGELDKFQVVPVRIRSIIVEHDNFDGSPKMRWIGQKAKVLELRDLLMGFTAKSIIDDIISL